MCSKTCYVSGEGQNGTMNRTRECGIGQGMCVGQEMDTSTCSVANECGKFALVVIVMQEQSIYFFCHKLLLMLS